MIRTLIPAALCAGLACGTAIAQTMVNEIEVEVDLPAVQNQKAAAYWTRLDDDLENAIVARLTDRIVPEDAAGAKITIDIDEVSLASSFESAVGVADSSLAGNVVVTHNDDNSKFDAYFLTITFSQAGSYFPAGTDLATIAADSPIYYAAMVDAFADRVVTDLK